MAAAPAGLKLMNATTHAAYKLAKQGGFYMVGNKVIVGDLYTDVTGNSAPILLIQREAPIEKLPAPEIVPAVKSIEPT